VAPSIAAVTVGLCFCLFALNVLMTVAVGAAAVHARRRRPADIRLQVSWQSSLVAGGDRRRVQPRPARPGRRRSSAAALNTETASCRRRINAASDGRTGPVGRSAVTPASVTTTMTSTLSRRTHLLWSRGRSCNWTNTRYATAGGTPARSTSTTQASICRF